MKRTLATLLVLAVAAWSATAAVRITEWMYQGANGEFIEFTNVGAAPVDFTGWSFDDDSRIPGSAPLSAFGVVQPGESVILTESTEAGFIANWGLVGVKVIGGLTHNLGRNDEINLYDAANNLVDRLTYGDQTFPGTIRTQNASGQTCRQYLGRNDIYKWQLAVVGDMYGTFTATSGDKGTPGTYNAPSCSNCAAADLDCDGDVDVDDLAAFVQCFGGPDGAVASPCPVAVDADFDHDGDVDMADHAFLQQAATGSNP